MSSARQVAVTITVTATSIRPVRAWLRQNAGASRYVQPGASSMDALLGFVLCAIRYEACWHGFELDVKPAEPEVRL